jgi:hypothetical protein
MAQQEKQRPITHARLFQLMSEVISLREQVAQAELALGAAGAPLNQRDKLAAKEKRR